jgi:hypothetical protein
MEMTYKCESKHKSVPLLTTDFFCALQQNVTACYLIQFALNYGKFVVTFCLPSPY